MCLKAWPSNTTAALGEEEGRGERGERGEERRERGEERGERGEGRREKREGRGSRDTVECLWENS